MRNVDAERLAAGYRKEHKAHKEKNKKPRKFGAASQRNGIRYVVQIIVAYIFVSMATILTQTQLQELPPGDRILRCRLG
ncbi:hypothetical protein [Nostoc sp.]|uniref:hypothetical protein n=1 Tax=Nostoc sp. TaxID=1180 RepID=UPI002FF71704